MNTRAPGSTDLVATAARGRDVVLLATGDDVVRADVARLAAAAGSDLRLADDVEDVRRSWVSSAVVLLGDDMLRPSSLLGLPRRDHVHVVAAAGLDAGLLRAAVAVGAASVVELPDGSAQLVDLLGDLADHERTSGTVVGIVAGSGGVGASVLTVAVATTALRQGAAALAVDLDPQGAGLDLVAGHDDQPGADWDSLAVGHGRLSSTALRESLNRARGPAVLGWCATSERASPPEAVVGEALSAARRGHDLVVVDSPSPTAWASCDVVVLLVAGSVHGIAAARRVAAGVPAGVPAGLVVRSTRRDAWAEDAGHALALPVWAVLTEQRALDEHLSAGLGPVRRRRGAVARAAAEIVARLRELP